MKIRAILNSTKTLHIRPAVTMLAPCTGFRRASSAREANVVGGISGQSQVVYAAHRNQKLRLCF